MISIHSELNSPSVLHRLVERGFFVVKDISICSWPLISPVFVETVQIVVISVNYCSCARKWRPT